MIDNDIMIAWGAVSKKYRKNEIIFLEGDAPRYYYQILSGRVKMFNNNDTKELTQGVFAQGDSFGEPALFIDESYPASAITLEPTVVTRILKERFFKILDEYPDLQKKLLKSFSTRIHEKSLLARELINSSPEERILTFLNQYRKKKTTGEDRARIDYTRQEIANFTGLCVETVIRTLTRMNAKGKVSIIDKKLYY